MPLALRRLLGAAALAAAAIVFVHVSTCRVTHATPAAPMEQHDVDHGEHLPKVVLGSAVASALAAVVLLVRLRDRLRLVAAPVADRTDDCPSGRGPPDQAHIRVPLSLSLCVFRC